MAQEIERQFIVNTSHPDWEKLRASLPAKRYVQATIHRGVGNKLRVRLIEDLATGAKSAAFTFKVQKKSKSHEPNIRDEYEWEVPYRVALFIMIGHKMSRRFAMNTVILMEKSGNSMSILEIMKESFLPI
jgi:CYTH domain-containing protein